MKVYAVMHWIAYEGSQLVAAYSTLDAANACADKLGRNKSWNSWGHEVIEVELDAGPDAGVNLIDDPDPPPKRKRKP